MEITTLVSSRARHVLVLLSAMIALAAPGCSLTTHFDDYQPGDPAEDSGVDATTPDEDGGGDDGGGSDGGDGGGGDTGVPTHTVNVTLTGAGSGTLTGASDTCDSACAWVVPDGTALVIHAAPDALSTFVAWGGACAATDPTADCMLTVTSDLDLSADFAIDEYDLTVVVSNPPGVVTATAPAGLTISCDGTPSGTCMGTVSAGTMVTLSAAPSLPNTQVAWAGAACTGTTCTFEMTADTTITATFSDGRPVLGVTITGEGAVVADDTRINCNAGAGDCSEIYDPETTTTLRATASVGYTFTSWSGCDAMTGDECTVTLSASRTVTATFTQNTYDLTVNVTGTALGMVTSAALSLTCTAADGTCTVTGIPHGTTISLVAAPGAGAVLSSWSGVSGCATATTCGFVITADTTATATFVPDTRLVQVAFSGGAGQIFADTAPFDCSVATTGGATTGTCMATLNVGSTFNLTVIPAAGSTFTGWTSAPVGIGCTGSTSSCAASVVSAIPGGGGTITAMFTPQRFNLTVTSTAASGGGAVTISPGPTMPTCTATGAGASCVNNYAYGTVVTLHGAPNAGSVFLGWSGGICSGTADCMVTMDAAKAVTGTFALMTDQLQVNTSGPTTGTVMSTSPAGAINCGSDCNETVPSGTVVTLTATAAMNYQFAGWSGGGCSGTGTCMVTVSGTTIVNATFTLLPRALTVTRMGTGLGTVTDDPGFAQISCGADCAGSYDHGTMVTLTANASAGSTFSGWGGACSGTSPTCLVAMTAARSVTAAFAPATAALDVLLSGTGSGRVETSDGMISCNQPAAGTDSCSATYTTPSTIVLTALPGSASTLGTWSGCDTVSADMTTCTVNLTSPRSVTMTFNLRRHLVNVAPSPAGLGSITSSDSLINCGGSCGAIYDEGSLVTLTATATAPNIFAGWTGVAGCGASSVCSFNVTSAVTATANFTAPLTLTLRVSGSALTSGSRVISTAGPGVSCTAPSSGTATCTSTVPPGTQFFLRGDGQPDYVGPIWSGPSGLSCSGPDCVFTLTASITINVSFAQLGNLMFVSSMAHSGMFGTTVATAMTGSSTFCQDRATAAGLPGTYIAWLGFGGAPMTTRIPAGDSVWVRPDGRPVATSRSQLFSGALTHAVTLTESGMANTNSIVLTGTNADGTTPASFNCSDWTLTSGMARTGTTGHAGSLWTDQTNTSCAGGSTRVYCVQTGGTGFATLAPPSVPDPVYIWTSSVQVAGDYTIGTMDRACDDEASMAGLPSGGTYVALIGTTGTTAFSRATLLGTLVRPDGWPIGVHGTTVSVLLNNAPNTTTWSVDYRGNPMASALSWTGMSANAGMVSASSCAGWTVSAAGDGGAGSGTSINASTWAGSTLVACSMMRNFYCIQSR